VSRYYGPIARIEGDRERERRRKGREADRERKRKAWLASPAGQEHLARKARRLERQKTCCVCGTPTPPAGISGAAGCCSWECAAVHWLYLDELEQARREGMPVAEWRAGPGAEHHADYLDRKARRAIAAQAVVKP